MADKNAEQEVVAETEASDSIAATNPSRSQLMSMVITDLTKLPTPELMDYCVKSMAFLNNPNLSNPTEGDEAANKASIKTKPSDASPAQTPLAVIQTVREDLDTVLSGQELPADAVEKLMTLFEAAVNARLGVEVTRLSDESDKRIEEETHKLIEQIDGYVDYAAQEFFKENQVAIENSLKIDMYEEFLDGLKELFTKHWVEIPEDRVDVAAALADRVDALETELNDKTQEVMDMEETLLALAASRVFESVTADMTDTDREKLRTLSESVEFDGDEEKLTGRIKTIRDAHFSPKKEEKKLAPKNAMLSEGEIVTVEVKGTDPVTNADPEVSPYVAAITRMTRQRV